MSNIIHFPHPPGSEGAAAGAGTSRHVGAAFLVEPAQPSHFVQFYDDEAFLYDTVGQFLAAGLTAGDRIIVIATPEHRQGFVSRLQEIGVEEALASGQLTLLDARETMARFMVGDTPDPDLFRDLLLRTMSKIRSGGHEGARVRAYGEMVDLLWRDGKTSAAIRLEELWNDAGNRHSFSLLCAYVMGNFYREGDDALFMQVCRNHTHVLPTESFTQLDDAHARLREISLLQQRARALESEIQQRKQLELALREALRERGKIEEELRACVARETEARARAEASEAFKEQFIGILGHDLRNPLTTILTTAHLMTMRGELPPASQKRLSRVVSSGERMQRMIEQLLDMTRARLAEGIQIARTEQDLRPLVAKIVDETRGAHPGRIIHNRADGDTIAAVDGDRLEQVMSNLLGNAIAHGDPARPIEVGIAGRPGIVELSVHNWGPAIEPEFLPLLFDPFARARPERNSRGLGLGLYISERIIHAHDGKIEVDSSTEGGTIFRVLIPSRRA